MVYKLKRDVRSRVGRLSSTACEDYLVEWVYRSRFNDPNSDADNVVAMFDDICNAAFTFMCAPDPEPDT